MRSSKINKMVQSDAFEWARAEMFFGEGAGTRRRLLSAEIEDKMYRIPGYRELFDKELGKQNWADHAIAAAKERKKLDRNKFLSRNLGALARGDRRGMSNGFAATVTVLAVAHATGYDKKILAEGKKVKADVEDRYRRWKAQRTIRSVN